MITYEEVLKQGIKPIGTGQKPDFTISTITNIEVSDSISYVKELRYIVNKNLCITSYSAKRIEHLIITLIILPNNWSGVEYKEQKYYKSQNKNLFLDLKAIDYDKFTTATKQEALSIMATEILRGVAKYLCDVKEFKFELFYADLERLFKEYQLI